MKRRTFISVSYNERPTTLFVHVDEQPDGSAVASCGMHSLIDDELIVFMTHKNPSFEAECQDWQDWQDSR